MRPLVLTMAALVVAGCGRRPEIFSPVERAETISPYGHRASIYEVIVEGQAVGEVTVWSYGADRRELPGGEARTLVHVGLVVESNLRPLRVEAVELDRVLFDGQEITNLTPTSVEGAREISTGEVGELQVRFAMPPGVMPQDVDAFHVRWVVAEAGGAGRYAQHTPFLEDPALETVGRYFYTPFRDPFFEPSYVDPTPQVIVVPSPR